jgi:arsenate reductase
MLGKPAALTLGEPPATQTPVHRYAGTRVMVRPLDVLFLCNGNSARSILAEALLSDLGGSDLRGFSAGAAPAGEVHPMALEVLAAEGLPVAGLRSKSWDEFAAPGAPEMDVVVTLCDQAAAETCPLWPGAPLRAHWSLPDPAKVAGDQAARRQAFRDSYETLHRLIGRLTQTARTARDRETLAAGLAAIGPEADRAGAAHGG